MSILGTSTGTVAPPDDALLVVDGISKHFGGVRALQNVHIWARAGEVTAVVGDNGAGKSTLIRCIAGVHAPDSGRMTFGGHEVKFSNPEQARNAGVETVHQSLALVDDLTVWQNLFMNREIVRGIGPVRILNRGAMRREAAEMLTGLAVNPPRVDSTVRRLSGGQRQAVALCRATGWGSQLVILDEPTAALGVQETAKVEHAVEALRTKGVAVILISHNFEQVLRLSDRVWVMRSGAQVGHLEAAGATGEDIVGLVTGAVGR